jgi:hypothetical protein
MPASFVLARRLLATYPKVYASVAGFSAALLNRYFEHPAARPIVMEWRIP